MNTFWIAEDLIPNGRKPKKRCYTNLHWYNGKILVFAGNESSELRYNDVEQFDPETHKWVNLETSGTAPTPRSNPTSCIYEDKMFAYGGYDGNPKRDFHVLDLKTLKWTKLSAVGTPPEGTSQLDSCLIGKWWYICGGESNRNEFTDKMSRIDLSVINDKQSTLNWESVTYNSTTNIQPQVFLTMNHYKGCLYVYGGRSSNSESVDDIWCFDLEKRTWSKIENKGSSKPEKRLGCASCIWDQYLLVVGGNSNQEFVDFWAFDLESHIWKQIDYKFGKIWDNVLLDEKKEQQTQNNDQLILKRAYHSVLVDPDRYVFYIYAGAYQKNFAWERYDDMIKIKFGDGLQQDLKSLLQDNQVASDVAMVSTDNHKYNLHSALLSARIKIKEPIVEMEKIITSNNKLFVDKLLSVIYCGNYKNIGDSDNEDLAKILKKLELTIDPVNNWINFRNDIYQLFSQSINCDFKLLVKDDDEEEDDDEDEDEGSKEDVESDDDDEEEDYYVELPVHKFMLAARSQLFKKMFKMDSENLKNVKNFSNFSLENIECFLKFIYRNMLILTADEDITNMYQELSEFPEYYQMNGFELTEQLHFLMRNKNKNENN
ncbi:kelch repeat protein [Anaeramoeba flamelloides]|uniref:Kelch repeat protein n=1 Tax=Anaeramoeba flamelloides TaxID=1746091 RepID=A0ABQ8YWM5_9EUKA|nr:kelch repeat protein [Anaeramoeba flamelloides]